MSHFEALFKFKLLGPHCVTAGKAGFQLMGPHVEVERMCRPSWREVSNFGCRMHCLWLLEVLSQLGRVFSFHPLCGPLHIQLGSRESQYRGQRRRTEALAWARAVQPLCLTGGEQPRLGSVSLPTAAQQCLRAVSLDSLSPVCCEHPWPSLSLSPSAADFPRGEVDVHHYCKSSQQQKWPVPCWVHRGIRVVNWNSEKLKKKGIHQTHLPLWQTGGTLTNSVTGEIMHSSHFQLLSEGGVWGILAFTGQSCCSEAPAHPSRRTWKPEQPWVHPSVLCKGDNHRELLPHFAVLLYIPLEEEWCF